MALQGDEGVQTERTLALLFASATLSLPGGVLATGPNVIAPIQRTLDDYLARRHDIEGVSAVFLHVDPGDPGPAIEAWSGSDGLRDNAPINGDTLFQIGSNTKHFEAAVALKLEADGKLDINQTLGECGWFYSNTNNILAALIIEKASGLSLKGAFEKEFKRIGLHDTFYSAGRYPDAVLARVPAGLYKNAACLAYQPAPCERSTIAPLIGKDMRLQNLSWAGGAGAIISNPRDLAKWVRALSGGRVIPQRQLDEMKKLVSQNTGDAVDQATEKEPAFGLDIAQAYKADFGAANPDRCQDHRRGSDARAAGTWARTRTRGVCDGSWPSRARSVPRLSS